MTCPCSLKKKKLLQGGGCSNLHERYNILVFYSEVIGVVRVNDFRVLIFKMLKFKNDVGQTSLYPILPD